MNFGLPGTIVHYRPHPFDINAGVYAGEKATEILKIAGGTSHHGNYEVADPVPGCK